MAYHRIWRSNNGALILMILFISFFTFAGCSGSKNVNKRIKELKDPDWNVRYAAVEALSEIKDARAVEPLIAALKDENVFVRRVAAWALGLINDARASSTIHCTL